MQLPQHRAALAVRGAGGCRPVPYHTYISALWGLCNPGLSVPQH